MREIQAQLEVIAQTLYSQLPPTTEEITEHSALLMDALTGISKPQSALDILTGA